MSSVPHPCSLFPLSFCCCWLLPTEGDYLSVRGAAAVAAQYMAAINVLAGWAILPFFLRSPAPQPPITTGELNGAASPIPPPTRFRWVWGDGSVQDEWGKDRGGIYSGAAGPCEGGRSIGPLPECRGNQPLITPAVVCTLLCASVSLHSLAWEFGLNLSTNSSLSLQPLLQAPHHRFCSRHCSTTTLGPPPPSSSPPFLITLPLFLSGNVRWSHSAGAAFHGHRRCRHLPSVNTAVMQVFASMCLYLDIVLLGYLILFFSKFSCSRILSKWKDLLSVVCKLWPWGHMWKQHQ